MGIRDQFVNFEREKDGSREGADVFRPFLSEPESDSLNQAHAAERARNVTILGECGTIDSASTAESGCDDGIVRIHVQSADPQIEERSKVLVDQLEELECDRTQSDSLNDLDAAKEPQPSRRASIHSGHRLSEARGAIIRRESRLP